MAKMAALASTNSKHKLLGVKEDKLWKNDDRISQIPDEVLVSILSLLTMKEAARTSVLSRRWERLWTFYTGSLNFDATKTLFSMQPVTETGLLEHAQRNKYVGWVNQVLTSLEGSSSILDEFKVRFDLDKYYSRHIDRWIEFVIERRVRKVELDFEPIPFDFRCTSMRSYTFPVEFYARVKEPRGLHNISALTSLCFKYVDVSREVIEFLLSNCPLLERLCVVASEKLLNLKVTGLPQLKYLEVSKCFNLKSLEISSAPNLLALKYVGQRIILQVENVPRLVEVSIGRENIISYMVGFLSSHLSQLETLVLDFNILAEGVFRQYFPLTNLKHLILRVEADYDPSIIGWTSLIEASPFLQKFTLELFSAKRPNWKRGFQKVTESSSPHQCLKVVRFVGFIGCTTEVELAMYFFENASMLEKIVIDHRHPSLIGTPLEFKKKNRAKKHAEKLKKILPRKVALVFI